MTDGLDKFIKFDNEDEIEEPKHRKSERPYNPREDFDADDGLETPDIKPERHKEGRTTVVVIDDDYQTLDIMKIYLSRDYECATFSDPKEAIFYMNRHLPDIIFVDCYMTVVNAKKIISIIRSYREMKRVPVYYMVYEEEKDVFEQRKDEDIEGIIVRPISRGDLQKILDRERLRDYLTGDPSPGKDK